MEKIRSPVIKIKKYTIKDVRKIINSVTSDFCVSKLNVGESIHIYRQVMDIVLDHINEHGLQDKFHRENIFLDADLCEIFYGSEGLSQSEIQIQDLYKLVKKLTTS